MFARTVVAVALLSSMVVAQNNSTYIDPNSVDGATRASWCSSESTACDTLCDQSTSKNNCDADTLDYLCLCASNDSSPDLAAYMDTMPYYICYESYVLCMDEHPSTDPDGQAACQDDILDECGTLDLANYTAAPSTTSSSASATATGSATSTSASAAATSSGAAVALAVGQEYGMVVVAAGIFGAFGALL